MKIVNEMNIAPNTNDEEPTTHAKDSVEVTETVVRGHFLLEHNGYKIYESPIGYLSKSTSNSGESQTKQLTNFLMSAKVVVNKDSGREGFLLDIRCNNNWYRDKAIDIAESATPSKFKEALGITEIYITATPTEFTVLLMAIQKKIKERMFASDVLGLHDDMFLVPSGCITKEGLVPGKIVLIEKKGDKHDQYYSVTSPHQTVWEEVATQFLGIFPNVNNPHKTLLILGWFLGCILKSALRDAGYKYPILNPFGTKESGKTSTITACLKFFGHIDPRSVQLDRVFPIMKLLSMTNALAVFLDEFRESLPNVSEIKRALRNSYDGINDSRGQADQSVVKYGLHAPLVICGEDTPTDAACQDRVVAINMRPMEKNTEAYFALQAIPNKIDFLGGYMVWVLNHQDEWQDILSEAASIVDTLGAFKSDRVKTSAVCVMFGLLLGIRLMEELQMETSFSTDDAAAAVATLTNNIQQLVGDHIFDMMYNIREYYSKMFGPKEFLVEINSNGRLIGFFKQSNVINSIIHKQSTGLTSHSITRKLEENMKNDGYIKAVSKTKSIKGCVNRVLEIDLSQLCEEYPNEFDVDDFSKMFDD